MVSILIGSINATLISYYVAYNMMTQYFQPAPLADWYGADNMDIDTLESQNIPYGGWGQVQPVFRTAYGADKSVPYGYDGKTTGDYVSIYGATITETLTTYNFVTGFLVGCAAIIGVGFMLNRSK